MDQAAGLALDGELADGADPASLPSGEGLPGGDLVARFTVVAVDLVGDLDCNGVIDFFDIDPFVVALLSTAPSYAEYHAQYPDCDHLHADCNQDGSINFFDIDPFVDLLLGT